jgi:outer membrane protein assembly factor BamB
VVYENIIYVCSDKGILTAYDAQSGRRIYKKRLGRSGANHFASPVAGDGKVYLANEDGEVIVVKAGTEHEIIAKNPMEEVVMATPAISDGVIYVRGLKHLFAIGEPTTGKAGAGR